MKIEELKNYLKEKEYTDDDISQFVDFVKPFYDFYEFMEITHNLSYENVEELSKEFSLEELPKYLENIKGVEDIIDCSGKIMSNFAEKYEYNNPDEVGQSLKYLMELTLINKLTKNNDN